MKPADWLIVIMLAGSLGAFWVWIRRVDCEQRYWFAERTAYWKLAAARFAEEPPYGEMDVLRKALVRAAIPLVVLQADDSRWLSPELKVAIADELRAVNEALGVEELEESEAKIS